MLLLTTGISNVCWAKKWNVLRTETNQIFKTIDPAKANDYTANMAVVNLYDGLVYPLPDGSIAPLIAKSWDASSDGMTYTFKLNEGVKFHDGSEVTAEDVKFSFG